MPAVCVRVANKGVTGYGEWKSAHEYKHKGVAGTSFSLLWRERGGRGAAEVREVERGGF
jgi:hypothetical protein